MFSGARASMLRPTLRAAFRQHVRRGYATVQERVATASDTPWQLAAVGVTVPGVMYLRKGTGSAPTAESARDFAKKEAKRAESVITEAKVEVESKAKEFAGEAEAKMQEAKAGVETGMETAKGKVEAGMESAKGKVEAGVESAKGTVEKAIGKTPPPSMSSSGTSSRASTPPSSP